MKLLIIILGVFITIAMAQVDLSAAAVPPKQTLLYRMEVLLGDRFALGPIPSGQDRVIIPIVGGSFQGPRVSGMTTCRHLHTTRRLTSKQGKVLNGFGADYRITDVNGNLRPDARYVIESTDGTRVFVQTEGPTMSDGTTLLRGKFETATNGTLAWMNDVVAVGVLTRGVDRVFIDMWSLTKGGGP